MQVPVAEGFEIGEGDVVFSFARSGGAGGQNVNKVNSKAQIWFYVVASRLPEPVKQRVLATYASRLSDEGALIVASDRHRDQRQNLVDCLEKLAAMLRDVWRPPKARTKTKPTRGSVRRRLATKTHQSDKKRGRGRIDDDG